MASFTDEILKFNPYVQEAPVETMVQVGMYKQQLYDQGVQKVQGYLDTIRGMDVAKDVHKEYLQQRMNQLKGEVTKVISADFSKSQLTDQIGSLATRVAGDPIIQNALQSTQRYKSEIARLQKDKADGKAMVQNEYDFQDRASKWLTDGDAQTSFNESYNPYVDIMGEFLKAYKEVHPDAELTQDAFRIGKDGKPEINPALEQKSIKGIDPNKVASVANMVFQRPEIQNQLRIEGKYNYRGATPQLLLNNLTENYQNSIDNINRRVEDLKIRAATSGNADKSQISKTIDQLNDQGTTLLREYEASANMINTDPEMYKTHAYKNNLKSQLITNYSWHDTAHTFEKSPVFDAQMDVLAYELNKAEFGLKQQEFAYKKVHDAQVLEQDWLKAQLTASRSKGKKLDANGNIIDDDDSEVVTVAGNPASSQGEAGSASFHDMRNQKQTELSQAIAMGVFEIANGMDEDKNFKNPIKLENGVYKYNVDLTGVSGYKTIQEAQDANGRLYAAARKEIMSGNPSPAAEKMFARVDPVIRALKGIEGTQKRIDAIHAPQIEKLKASVGDLNAKVGVMNGKQVTRNDMVDLWLTNSGTPEAGNAAERLRRRGLPTSMMAATFMIAGSPTLNKENQEIHSKLGKNKELASIYTAREKAYKDAQTTFIPLESSILASTPREKERLRTLFSQVATARIKGNDSGDIEEFQSYIKKDASNGDDKFVGSNMYGFDRDNATGETYLTISRGGEKKRIKVQESDLANIPGAQQRNAFWSRFGDELSLTNNTTTDVPQPDGKRGGEATAHILPRTSKSNYNVKYHVIGNGKDYDLKLYVRDRKGKIIANSVVTGSTTGMDGIMELINNLGNDRMLEAILHVNGITVNK